MTPQAFAQIMDSAYLEMRPWSAKEIAQTIESAHVTFLSHQNGGLIARIVAGDCEILAIATAPRSQRSGIGSLLLKQLTDLARTQGADRIFLDVASGNTTARAFYAAHGFAQIGQRACYYTLRDGSKDDALVLSRPIALTGCADTPTS